MRLEPYRPVLALPGVRSLILVAVLARVPVTATGITLTLHVVLDLERAYAAAGLVGAAFTIGAAVGAPLLGRLVDRRGLRVMLAITTVAEAVFWGVAPSLAYPVLFATALVGGLLALPVFSVVRQSLAVLVPEQQRRQAYALDSISVELSFMAGPALAVLLATAVSPRVAMVAVGAGIVASGLVLFVLNPPTHERTATERTATERTVTERTVTERTEVETTRVRAEPMARRIWLRPRLVAVLAISSATTVVLAGTDVAIVAVLRDTGQVQWTGAVLVLWGAYSMVGGFVYGAAARAFKPLALLAMLSAFTIPVGLAGTQWWWLGLALLPAGALCAPTLAATSEAVSLMVPADARGEAMGLYGSALTVGLAIGAPLAGAVIDRAGPGWGFAAIGIAGALVVLASLVATTVGRHGRTSLATTAASENATENATEKSTSHAHGN